MTQLEIKAIMETGTDGNKTACVLVATDQSGNIHVAHFHVMSNYAKQIDKSFKRIIPVRLAPVKEVGELFTTV